MIRAFDMVAAWTQLMEGRMDLTGWWVLWSDAGARSVRAPMPSLPESPLVTAAPAAPTFSDGSEPAARPNLVSSPLLVNREGRHVLVSCPDRFATRRWLESVGATSAALQAFDAAHAAYLLKYGGAQ